ncbi:MAG: 50S ribosomal protein L11 methyltransferase [Acidobacteria bacterium]|nr:50S ribosomal protein L11 methyltransferase [Acidobacteriota bacterium]
MNGFYAHTDIHRRMLLDDVRNRAYLDALLATVKPGDVVLDFGAGTGILSLFAARAGARRVYAVERGPMAHVMRRIVAANGEAERVRVIEEDMQNVSLPEKVDCIVSEWLGTFGVDENLLPPLLMARDRWLKPGGVMLPQSVKAVAAPVWSRELSEKLDFFRGHPYGLDLSLMAEATLDELAWPETPVTPEDYVSEPQPMWTTDVYADTVEQARLPFRASLSFKASRAGKVNALVAWFTADFGRGITLSTAPDRPPTHWKQYLIPLHHASEVEAGTEIRVEYVCIPAYESFCYHAWSTRVGSEAWQHHDTRRTITASL